MEKYPEFSSGSNIRNIKVILAFIVCMIMAIFIFGFYTIKIPSYCTIQILSVNSKMILHSDQSLLGEELITIENKHTIKCILEKTGTNIYQVCSPINPGDERFLIKRGISSGKIFKNKQNLFAAIFSK